MEYFAFELNMDYNDIGAPFQRRKLKKETGMN